MPVGTMPEDDEDEKLEPEDLLPLDDPLLELLDECVMSVSTGPDEDDASLCVQTPSARNVFMPGMWIATVRTRPSMRFNVSMRSSPSPFAVGVIRQSPTCNSSAEQNPQASSRRTRNWCSGVALRRRLITTNL